VSHVPIIASTSDLPWAIRRAERYVESRAYVAERAFALGAGQLVPSSWGLVAAGPSAAVREKAAAKGQALPDGSYPIRNEEDLHKAIQAFGRAKDKAAAKRHIIKRARALGAVSELPEDWGVTASITAAGWNASLHPRDRDGQFIEKLGLLNLFDGIDFGKPTLRAEAIGVRNEGGKDILTVRAKSVGAYGGKPRAVGDEFDVPADKVEAAPEKKAEVHPVFTGEVEPKGPPIKGEATDLKKARDRADAAAAELADAEASGDKARITKARTSNTAAQKNLAKQQGLEDQAEVDLLSQLEQSVAQLDATPEPEEPDVGSIDDAVEALMDELGEDNFDPADAKSALVEQGFDPDEVDAALDRFEENYNRGAIPTGQQPDDEDDFDEDENFPAEGEDPDGEMDEDEEDRGDGFDDEFEDGDEIDDGLTKQPSADSNYDEDGTLSDDAEGSLEDDPDTAADLEQDFVANLEPTTEWGEGDSPIDDEVEYGKHIFVHAASYEEVNNEEGDSDPDLAAAISDLGLALSGDVGDPNVRDEIRVRADALRDNLIAEEYADDYELPKFGGGPASNHGIDDNAGDDFATGMSPRQKAADKWENDHFDYLESLDEDVRADIEGDLADENYSGALQTMEANYEFGHGDAIDSFREEVADFEQTQVKKGDEQSDALNALRDMAGENGDNPNFSMDEAGRELMNQGFSPESVDSAMAEWEAESGVAEQFAKENPQPTTDLYEAKDPEVQAVFDEWASAMRENGYTDEQIAQRVEFAENSMGESWNATNVNSAAEQGKANAQFTMGRDRLAMFPVGDPGKIGFGGYEVWHTNTDGSKNGGRGQFPDRETAQAYIDASNAESDRKLQERLDAIPAQVDKWAEGKDPFTVKQALLNIDATIPEMDPQSPEDADQLKILLARKSRMEEILAKAPTPEPDPVPEVVAPSGTNVDAAPNASSSPQRLAIEQSLGTSATNKGLDKPNLESVFSAGSPEDAHKALAAEMTRLKLGGKQRARMRQMLDIHFGDDSGSSAAVSAKATADSLSEDNPLKAKLEAAVAKATPGPVDVAGSEVATYGDIKPGDRIKLGSDWIDVKTVKVDPTSGRPILTLVGDDGEEFERDSAPGIAVTRIPGKA
jgi:hypothetical protein